MAARVAGELVRSRTRWMVSFGRPATVSFPAAGNDLVLLVDLSMGDLLPLAGGAGYRLWAPAGWR
jgi:hypothetical protein